MQPGIKSRLLCKGWGVKGSGKNWLGHELNSLGHISQLMDQVSRNLVGRQL